MKVELVKRTNLVAVINPYTNAVFLKDVNGKTYMLQDGVIAPVSAEFQLQELLSQSEERKPIYDGDSITITF